MNSVATVESPAPTKLFIPGRGVEDDGTLCNATDERVVVAAEYANEHAEVTTIIPSGGVTYLHPNLADMHEKGIAEAKSACRRLGSLVTRNVQILTDPDSNSTVNNWLKCARAGYFEPGDTVGVVSQRDHMPRILWLGHLIVPQVELVPIVVPGEVSRRSLAIETVQRIGYRALMLGVRKGNLDAIQKRNDFLQRNVLRAAPVVRRILGHGPAPEFGAETVQSSVAG